MKTWTIQSLETLNVPEIGTVVRSAFAISESGQAVYYTVNLLPADTKNFIPYADITQDEVIQWTQDAIGQPGILQMYQALDNLIAQAAIPSPQPEPLPWVAAE
jgi:hypothetical protein